MSNVYVVRYVYADFLTYDYGGRREYESLICVCDSIDVAIQHCIETAEQYLKDRGEYGKLKKLKKVGKEQHKEGGYYRSEIYECGIYDEYEEETWYVEEFPLLES